MCEIKCTVKVSFYNGGEKPNMGEIVTFVKSLDTDVGQIETVYRIAEEKSMFIKYKSEESMRHTLTVNPEELIFHYANGKEAQVRMSHAGEFIQYVRVYDLPPEVSDHELALVLGKYGKVKRVIREKFPAELNFDAYTGVRGVYMDVKKEIPTSLHFLNRKGNIYYPGNKDKCFLCQTDGHRMNSCPKRKTRKEPGNHQDSKEKEQSGSTSTYAGVVTAVAPSGNIQETKEVLEEEMAEAAMTPTDADISEDDPLNHPLYKFVSTLATELPKLVDAQDKAKEEEQAKIKSPPRQKKKYNLYKR